MKPYPAYKESGIAWLNNIPAHWKVQKLKWLAKVNLSNVDKKSKEDEPAVQLCNYTDVYYNEKITASIDFMKATASQDKIDSLTLESGDVLITKDSESSDDIAVPAYVPETLHGVVCGYHLAHIRPNENRANGNYLFRAFSSNGIRDQFEVNANGVTRFGIGKYTIENALFVVPPIEEQQAIADYLDRKTAVIDTLIAKKERQIELLQEQRTAVINHAVTKGLNPHAPLKDSDTDWLSNVPKHWQMMKFKFFASIQKGQVDPREDEYAKMILIAPNHIESGTGRILYTETAVEQGADSGKYLFKGGDVIYSKIRPELRKACSVNYDGLCSADMYPITTNEHMLTQFLLYVLLSEDFTKYSVERSMRVAMPKINRDDLNDCLFAVPPLNEQKEIVEHITTKASQIDAGIETMRKQIELLHEYRTAVISAAVTGKIDVRGIQVTGTSEVPVT